MLLGIVRFKDLQEQELLLPGQLLQVELVQETKVFLLLYQDLMELTALQEQHLKPVL